MKRSRFGLALLVGLLALSLLAARRMERVHQPVVQALTQAAQAGQAGSWDRAGELYRQALALWEAHTGLRSCLADHTPLEEVESELAQLAAYAQAEESADFAAACRSTARKVAAISQAHAPEWGNLF